VGTRASTMYHVFELEMELPKFSMYASMDRANCTEPESSVSFTISERIPRLSTWVEHRCAGRLLIVQRSAQPFSGGSWHVQGIG
jgi:hypothetical protein